LYGDFYDAGTIKPSDVCLQSARYFCPILTKFVFSPHI